MSLVWTPEMKQIAKDEKRALVKLQVQLKHCDSGGNFSVVGPFPEGKAMALYLLALTKDPDKIAEVLRVLALPKPEPPAPEDGDVTA